MDWHLIKVVSDVIFIVILTSYMFFGQIIPLVAHTFQFSYQKKGLYIDPIKARRRKIFY